MKHSPVVYTCWNHIPRKVNVQQRKPMQFSIIDFHELGWQWSVHLEFCLQDSISWWGWCWALMLQHLWWKQHVCSIISWWKWMTPSCSTLKPSWMQTWSRSSMTEGNRITGKKLRTMLACYLLYHCQGTTLVKMPDKPTTYLPHTADIQISWGIHTLAGQECTSYRSPWLSAGKKNLHNI